MDVRFRKSTPLLGLKGGRAFRRFGSDAMPCNELEDLGAGARPCTVPPSCSLRNTNRHWPREARCIYMNVCQSMPLRRIALLQDFERDRSSLDNHHE